MNRKVYSPPGERFNIQRYRTKSYSQILFFFAILPGLLLADIIIIFILHPTIGKKLYSGTWTIIGANILGILSMLLISTGIPFIIRVGNDSITVIGFPYKYIIRKEDIESVILLTGGFCIKPRSGIKYTLLLGCRDYPGYKYILILPSQKTYEAYIEIANMFLPLISRVDIIWENVPEKYKPQVIELVNKWREMKGY